MPSPLIFSQTISQDLSRVEEELKRFASEPGILGETINHHIIKGKGKLLRPAIMLLVGRLQHSVSHASNWDTNSLITLAASIELFHSATLLLDDVIDNAKTRRGIPTVNSIWGNKIAILVADYCLAKTFNWVIETKMLKVTSIFSKIALEVSKSEILKEGSNSPCMNNDLEAIKKAYYSQIDSRTASLFSASCQIGSIIGGGSTQERGSFGKFGLYLGRSFQIVDDILDFVGEEEQLGKPIGNDLQNGRVTLPTILTLETLAGDNILWGIMQPKKLNPSLVKEGLQIVKSSGGIEKAYSEAQKWKEKAMSVLNILPDNEYREHLKGITEYSVQRKK